MIRAFTAGPALLRLGFASALAYRAELVIWILSALLPLVMLALWNAVASGGPVRGYEGADLARYFTATLIVRQLTGAWVFWQLQHEIRSGALSARLLRPMHPLIWSAAQMLAAIPLRLAVLTPVVAALVLWRPDLLAWPGAANFGLFLISIAMAWLLAFLVQAALAITAFWTDQSDGLFSLWFAAWSVLSGYIAPLAFFPEAWRGALAWAPFRGMVGLPVELLGGFLRPEEAAFDLAVQAGWVLVLLAVVSLGWRRGVARFGAFGN